MNSLSPHAGNNSLKESSSAAVRFGNARLIKVRAVTKAICDPLEIEDYGLQCMVDTSPPKWHLAHTTWFFETFLLIPYHTGYRVFNPYFHELFNSYYQSLGTPFLRSARGMLSRPTVPDIYAYRDHVDQALAQFLAGSKALAPHVTEILEWGIQHEQQHQELLLMDIKYNFAFNPLRPAYVPVDRTRGDNLPSAPSSSSPLEWIEFSGGNCNLGVPAFSGTGAFAFDNETPRHTVYLAPYALANRLTTCGEYLRFMNEGGYERSEFWLSDGWEIRKSEAWQAPHYWEKRNGDWWHYTLRGMEPVDPANPVCHVSYYEADAYTHWARKRLPTEAEWENAVLSGNEFERVSTANLLESNLLSPAPVTSQMFRKGLQQAFGDVWEWTQSAYSAYPGFKPPEGALGEYNGKFMNNQRVLRGGSCVTPASHIRPSYRNFFRPESRWAFTGIRLCDAPRM